jgi:hypothetical protein
MNKLIQKAIWLLLLFTFAFQFETSAQIHDIKKKSKNNKSSHSKSSSSSDTGNDIASECVGGCLTEIFSSVLEGCISGIFSGGHDDDNNNYTYNENNGFEDDYLYEEPKTEITEEKLIPIDTTTNKIETEIVDNNKSKTNITEHKVSENTQDFSLELKPQFDIGFHKGIDKNYTHVDYLPGIRANLNVVSLDFRYNILTEYTDDFPDSFKSWELLFMLNLSANQDFKINIGTGIHREIWDDEPISFHEYYFGTQIPFANGADYFDADTRFSVDYETEAFPFFEIGGRFNKRFLNFDHLSGYITLGATYQNYYQSYDIWALRGGVVIKWH